MAEHLADPNAAGSPDHTLFVVAVAGEIRTVLETRDLWPVVDADMGWPLLSLAPNAFAVITGIGRANAAAATAWALARQRVQRVINIGVAGALPDSGLSPGDVVVADACVFHEEGIELPDGWRDVDELGFPLGPESIAEGNVIAVSAPLLAEIRAGLPSDVRSGRIATVAVCSGTDAAASSVWQRTRALAEAMEGAAVVSTARRLGCEAAEIRVISNTCGDRAAQQWDFQAAVWRIGLIVRKLIEMPRSAE